MPRTAPPRVAEWAVHRRGSDHHRRAARFVIHTVGPVYGACDGCEAELLGACHRNAGARAAQHRWATLAFPAISTGRYGYPRAAAAVAAAALHKGPSNRSVSDGTNNESG